MKQKILIIGKGFIGGRLLEGLQCEISDRKIYTFEDAENEIQKYSPSIIINCIGYTGVNNVDDCELDKDKTIFANVAIPIILAEIAIRKGIKMVHISSGCIYHYHGSEITENLPPDYFKLFYSRSKIYAERALSVLAKSYPILIVRIRIPLDIKVHSHNLLTKLIKYKKVIDIPNSITYIPDFIKAVEHLISIDARGIYNVVNKGGLRYPQLMEYYKKAHPEFEYKVIDFEELGLNRTNLILSTQKLEQSGFKVRNIEEVIPECIGEYVKNERRA
ncbi:MAG: hypothetical protein DRP74_00590 [Candidatus Omnitrophota bacterium]|nr:MAG: hypothetical protein DRP74_00590 [Candidatus Omnitrophota bacterium]